jgi:hypothetical protein
MFPETQDKGRCRTLRRARCVEALKLVGNGGWGGAKIYDVLLMGRAARCDADRIHTFNLGDFWLLASARLLEKVCAP